MIYTCIYFIDSFKESEAIAIFFEQKLNIWVKCTFFYKKDFYKKMSLKNWKTLRKCFRKSPVSNA